MQPFRRALVVLFACWLLPAAGAHAADPAPLRVAVLDDAPPLAYRDDSGELNGFSVALMRALCAEMAVQCVFGVVKLEHLVSDMVAGHFDVAAVGLLRTPERRQRLLFTRPVYRSLTLYFAPHGLPPGSPKARIATFKGSAQERYLKAQGWALIGAQSDEQMIDQLQAGVARACVVPLMTGLSLQKNPRFLRLDLKPEVLQAPDLESEASFAIAPQRADLKPQLDKALENIKRNGVFDRINSLYLPLRID